MKISRNSGTIQRTAAGRSPSGILAVFLAMLVPPAVSAGAETIRGRVVERDGAIVRIASESEWVPNAGDPAEIYFEIPGVDEGAMVARGKVTETGGDAIAVRVEQTYAEPKAGHLARITSEQPKRRKPASAPNAPAPGRGDSASPGYYSSPGAKLMAEGLALFKKGKETGGSETAEARRLFEQAVQLLPGDVYALSQLAYAQYALGELDGASASYARAIQLQPAAMQLKFYRAMLADVQMAREDYPAALQTLRGLLLSEPNYPEAHSLMGMYHLLTGATPEAAGEFRAAASLSKNIAVVHYNRAKELERHRQYARAVSHYVTVTFLDPEFQSAYFWAGFCCAEAGRKEEAILFYRRYIEVDAGKDDAEWPERARREIQRLSGGGGPGG